MDVPQDLVPLEVQIIHVLVEDEESPVSNPEVTCPVEYNWSELNASTSQNWQCDKSTVKGRLEYLFNSELLSDIHFNVGNGTDTLTQRIPAHKFVLSMGSIVFDAMFNGALSETAENIDLPDVEPSAFLAFLRFLYLDELVIEPENVMATLYVAKKYVVPALEKCCVEFLRSNLCSENAFLLLMQAQLFDEPQLVSFCLDAIDRHTLEAVNSDYFRDVDVNTLCVVLQRNTLRIREVRLFEAIVRWAESECQRQKIAVTIENKRTILKPCLPHIRFPTMSVIEFASGPAQSGLLSKKQIVSLFLYFTLYNKPPIDFLDRPRCVMTGKGLCMSRFEEIRSRWGYCGASDRIRFLVNRRIYIVGFGLFGSINGPTDYEARIQIITATGIVVGSKCSKYFCDGSGATNKVFFKEPVEILSNYVYLAIVTMKGCDSYCGTKGQRVVTVDTHCGETVTFNFSSEFGNNNGTSVDDGQIPEILFFY